MTVAKITEITAKSTKSFEDAIQKAIERADETLDGISGAWVETMKVDVANGKVTSYRVNLKITFVLKPLGGRKKAKKKASKKAKKR